MQILVIEDTPELRAQVRQMLEDLGHRAQLCESVIEALEWLHQSFAEHQRVEVDAILAHIDMPYMDGIETCRHIQANEKFRAVPLLMLAEPDQRERLPEAFAAGALDYLALPLDATEVQARLQMLASLKVAAAARDTAQAELLLCRQELGELQRQLEEANQALKRLSTLDNLTELPNRRSFEIALEREWKRALRTNDPMALLLIEVDFFEAFNQAYGHPAGNECLKRIAGILSHYPYRPGDIAARFGGIEFAVLLTNTQTVGAAIVAENIRFKLAELNIPHSASPVGPRVTASMGVASLIPATDKSPQLLLEATRAALDQARSQGRDRVQVAE